MASSLEKTYLGYVAALNQRPFPGLEQHVHQTVKLNGNAMPLPEYEKLLTDDMALAPDLTWQLSMLLVDEEKQRVGCRIEFRCTPTKGVFMDRKVDGTVKCMEHMFYQYSNGKIEHVWWMPGDLVPVEGEE
ncbi:hypothetical protein CDD81_2581 [Ophiocordyceps australis]|uniref:SnoaL-like domain-containing protein n=1 Tax=Ophiocordyceps australis TaxID=1399860 RepID=A0A2C5XTK0_9HYPO|nr:hypothetical protein CDD81_2581 [Ophiocordyceps australis]